MSCTPAGKQFPEKLFEKENENSQHKDQKVHTK